MAFTVIEWFVLVFVAIGLIKLIIIAFDPKVWLNVAKKLYGAQTITFTVILILAAVLFYYLLQSFTIVQIMAGVTLGGLLTALSFVAYSKDTISWATKILKKGMLKKIWLPILIWLVLIVWTLGALFGLI